MASPILRDTIKKLRARQALLQRQVRGPLQELRQIEEDLRALGAAPAPRRVPAPRAPRGAHQAAILRAVRNGATTPQEVTEKTGIAGATVKRAITDYLTTRKLLVEGANGLALSTAGRARLRELEAVPD